METASEKKLLNRDENTFLFRNILSIKLFHEKFLAMFHHLRTDFDIKKTELASEVIIIIFLSLFRIYLSTQINYFYKGFENVPLLQNVF